MAKKETKIDAAIRDTKLYLYNAKEQIKLLIKERDVLQVRLESLEIIKNNDDLE